MWQQWMNVLLGLWVIAVPFLSLTGNGLVWTLIVTGAVITALGAWGAWETTAEQEEGNMIHRTT